MFITFEIRVQVPECKWEETEPIFTISLPEWIGIQKMRRIVDQAAQQTAVEFGRITRWNQADLYQGHYCQPPQRA